MVISRIDRKTGLVCALRHIVRGIELSVPNVRRSPPHVRRTMSAFATHDTPSYARNAVRPTA